MSQKQKAVITGVGSYLPEKVVTNQDFEKIIDTSDEWIQKRTGIKERRFASDDESASTMGARAAKVALERARIDISGIDLIITATMTPDYISPATATIIQSALGAHCPAFDIGAACSGFIFGLSVVKAYIESGAYRRILFIATEKMSSFLNFQDRSSCILFGDGAAACVIEADGEGFVIEDVILGSDGAGAELIIVPAGGSKCPTSEQTVLEKKHYITMDGKEVFKHAVRRMAKVLAECLERNHVTIDQVDYIIPHQANVRIIDAIVKNMQCPEEKMWITVDKIANTSASSIGLALDDLLQKKTFEKGIIALTAFGAGLTWGSALLKKSGIKEFHGKTR